MLKKRFICTLLLVSVMIAFTQSIITISLHSLRIEVVQAESLLAVMWCVVMVVVILVVPAIAHKHRNEHHLNTVSFYRQ